GVGSVTAPIQAVVPNGVAPAQYDGTVGNLPADTPMQMVSATPFDSVALASGLTNGMAPESDAAFRARFPLYLAGLQKADEDAIESAIAGVQQGIKYIVVENKDYPGLGTDNGNFFVIVDDGSGDPPASLLTAVANAIDAVRGFTIRFQVEPPSILTAAINMTINVAPGFVPGVV